jgi:transposase
MLLRNVNTGGLVEHYVGIDVSLELSSICVVDGRGKIVKEAKVASEPEALVCFFKELGVPVNRIGLEAGPLSQWLHAGLSQAGFQTVLLETRHVKAALSAMTVKTDRKDACGLAQLLRMGWFQQGARQIDWIAGDPSAASCAQAASRKVAGRGIEHSGNPARLRPEGRPGDAQDV